MPTYQNNSATERYLLNPGHVFIEPQTAVEVDYYFNNLPESVVIIDHEPYATLFTLIDTLDSFPSAVIDVTGYELLYVLNATNAVVGLQANTNTDSSLFIPAGGHINFKTMGKIGTLKAASGGTGSLYIIGFTDANALINGSYYAT